MRYIPNIIDNTPNSEHVFDLISKLLKERIILLYGEIDDNTSAIITAQLLYLASLSDEPIHLYINSPGGLVYAGLAIYDTMQFIKCPVYTYCTGIAASMAAVLLAGGESKHRYILNHSEVMIHQPLGGIQGQASDMDIAAKHIMRIKESLAQILSKHTGQDITKIYQDSERDYYLNASEAKAYGLVDEIKIVI